MAGQVRVLQLDADEDLETKLFRLEKGKTLIRDILDFSRGQTFLQV